MVKPEPALEVGVFDGSSFESSDTAAFRFVLVLLLILVAAAIVVVCGGGPRLFSTILGPSTRQRWSNCVSAVLERDIFLGLR